MRPRRFLPSLSMLTAFEAVVTCGSVSGAARQLSLTQSTVSRLVQALEEQLGCILFTRQRKRLTPTQAALAYYEKVRRGLDSIQEGGLGLIANPEGGSLALAVLPTFGTRWLAPRLGRFFDGNPGVTINLATRVERFGFDGEPFHAVIYFGAGDWAGLHHLKLFDERYTACAAPSFIAEQRILRAQEVVSHSLLILQSRGGTSWNTWLRAQGLPERSVSGMVVDQFSMAIQAAISGLGVALLPDYLASLEMQEGRLAPLGQVSVPGDGAYWLAWPERSDRLAPLAAFRRWLEDECG
jgi:LysR family transcriptional regulator, glycine cleavage system transcriptional activator